MTLTKQRRKILYLLIAGISLYGEAIVALELNSGVGLGVEYTDNATLDLDNKITDQITTAYAGLSLAQEEGPLVYDVFTSFTTQSYIHDTYEDRNDFNLIAEANWEMIRERFTWTLTDKFSQRTINALDSNTPANLQDSNAFNLAADIKQPVFTRQILTLIPQYSDTIMKCLTRIMSSIQ